MTRALAAAAVLVGLLSAGADARAAAALGQACHEDAECVPGSVCGAKQVCIAPATKNVFPFYFSNSKRTVSVVPPLLARWTTPDHSTNGLIAGPLVSETDNNGSTTALVPIYWHFHDKHRNATTGFLFPILGFHHHAGARGAFVGPFYGWSSKNSDGWGAGLAPFILFGRTGPRRHVIVPPLFAHVADAAAGTQTTAVGPLFVRTTRDGGDGGLFPLLFAGRHGRRNYGVVPGLFYHRSDGERSLDVVGPVYAQREPGHWAGGLVPLAFFGGGSTGRSHQAILPPLFVHTRDTQAHTERLLIGPYFHRQDGDERADVLFPIFYLRRAPSDGFGLWLIGGYQRAHGVSTTVVGPFIRRTDAGTGARTTMLFPLAAWHDSPAWSVRVLFPILWRVRDGAETNTVVFPLYFGGRSPNQSWDVVLPLFAHARTPAAATTVVGPLWYRAANNGGRSVGLLPLFGWGKQIGPAGKATRWFAMPGLYSDKNEAAGTSHTWALLFFHSGRPDGYVAGLLPLAFAWRRGTTASVLAPFYYRKRDDARDSTYNWLVLGWYGREGRAHRFGIFPLTFVSTHGDGTFATGLFPLFYANKRTDGSTLVTLLGGYKTSAAGKRVLVGPVYYRKEGDVSAGGLLPLIYHQRNAATGARVSFGLPLYFEDRIGDGREIAEYSPLVWRYHSVESTLLLGLPLFFDAQRFAESRTTALLPIFVRHRGVVSQATSWLVPPLLSWWRHGPGATDAVVFPFVWRFGGKDPTTVVFPFVWRFIRGESRTTVVFPLGARWYRPDAVHTLAPFVYYKKGIGPKQGSWYLNVFPLLAVGRPRTQDLEWYFLEGLFGYSRQGRNRNLRLLWVLDFKLEPVPASNLSWFGSTPTNARELF
jgi:hypothetical protein